MTEQSALTETAWTMFESRLRRYVGRRLDPSSVDDAVGDILLRLVQNQEALNVARNPLAWALRVAANVVTDHHRRRATEQRALSRAQAEQDPEPAAAEYEDATAASEIARCLVPLIRDLPQPYSEALLLTEIEGLTQAAAAARSGISVSGMKSRVQRGRAKLKRALLRCCTVQVDRRGGVLDYQPRTQDCGRSC